MKYVKPELTDFAGWQVAVAAGESLTPPETGDDGGNDSPEPALLFLSLLEADEEDTEDQFLTYNITKGNT